MCSQENLNRMLEQMNAQLQALFGSLLKDTIDPISAMYLPTASRQSGSGAKPLWASLLRSSLLLSGRGAPGCP